MHDGSERLYPKYYFDNQYKSSNVFFVFYCNSLKADIFISEEIDANYCVNVLGNCNGSLNGGLDIYKNRYIFYCKWSRVMSEGIEGDHL